MPIMRKPNKLRSTLLIASCGLLINCASTPPPPDIPVCEHLNQFLGSDPKTGHLVLRPSPKCMTAIGEVECGHCTYIMSGKEKYVGEAPKTFLNKKPWSQLRRESLMLPAVEAYAPLSEFIINTCQANHCDGQVERFKVKLDSLNGIGDLLKRNSQLQTQP